MKHYSNQCNPEQFAVGVGSDRDSIREPPRTQRGNVTDFKVQLVTPLSCTWQRTK